MSKVKLTTQKSIDNNNEHYYEFMDVTPVQSTGFNNAFGVNSTLCLALSLMQLLIEYPNRNWQAFQSFECESITYYAVSNAIQGCPSEYDLITFCLPDEY